jgi:uncharacterized membrane protein YidH (DUF202 family)
MTSHDANNDQTPDDPDVPGLAGERTDLAWSRTALAVAVAGAALLRRVWEHLDTSNGRVVVFTLLGVGAAAWLTALTWAHGAARTTMEGRHVASRAALRRVTIGTMLFCLAALILALAPVDG